MAKLTYPMVLLSVILLVGFANAATEVSSCANLNVSNTYYLLTADIIDNESTICFNISANNVTLDCQGHTIDGLYTGGPGQTTYGIYVKRASSTNTNITIKNCSVSAWYEGVYLNKVENNLLSDINITSNARGIFISYSNNNIVRDITSECGQYSPSIAITQGYYNTLNNLEINYAYTGLYFLDSGKNNVTNVSLNSISGSAIKSGGSVDNKYTNITIWNCSSGTKECIRLESRTQNNTFENVYINDSSNLGISFNGFSSTPCDNNTFRNITIENTDDFAVYLQQYAENNTFINATYDDESLGATSTELIREWYLDVNVSSSTGSSLEGANVTGWNVSGSEIFSELTDSSGRIARKELIQYVNDSGTTTYHTNYTINTTKTGYVTNSTEINLTENTWLNVVLAKVPIDFKTPGNVKKHTKISDGLAGFEPTTGGQSLDDDWFGSSVTNIGDLDGDGIQDLAVGAYGDENDNGGDDYEGAVYILFMNTNGSVRNHTKISDGLAGFEPTTGGQSLGYDDAFGWSVANIGDLDGDGIQDLAVGACYDENDNGGDDWEGAVYILSLSGLSYNPPSGGKRHKLSIKPVSRKTYSLISGSSLSIDFRIKNTGDYDEKDVKVYIKSLPEGLESTTETIDIDEGKKKTVTLVLEATDAEPDTYRLRAVAKNDKYSDSEKFTLKVLPCSRDSQCAWNESCSNGTCKPVECACGVVGNHSCAPYECCSDSDCATGESCSNNVCVASEPPEEEPTAPPTPPAEGEEETPEGGVEEGPQPSAMPDEGAQPGAISDEGAGEPALEPAQDLTWIIIILIVIALVLLALFLIPRERRSALEG